MIVRSLPDAPTLTVDEGVVPAKLYVTPLMIVLGVATAVVVVEPEPKATAPALLADAPEPIATPLDAFVLAALPKASEFVPDAVVLAPSAVASAAPAVAPNPRATPAVADACTTVKRPIAMPSVASADGPSPWAALLTELALPSASEFVPAAVEP